jgi:uncharacterized protein (TIGR00369 family)
VKDERNYIPTMKQTHYGVASTDEKKLLSGFDFVKRMKEGLVPAAPISKVMQFRLTEVEQGHVVFSAEPSVDFYNPLGTVHGGYAATLLDSCMGCAVHSTLPAGMAYTTLEFKINFVRPITDKTGSVRAEGRVIAAGKRVATAEGRLLDANGKLYAHGTTTCLIFPL